MPFTTKVEHLEPYARLSPAKLSSEFASKHVFISGGGYGIGASIARAFAEANAASIVIAGALTKVLHDLVDQNQKAEGYPKSTVVDAVVKIPTISVQSQGADGR